MRFVSWFLDGSFEIYLLSQGYEALEEDLQQQFSKGRILIRCYSLAEHEKGPDPRMGARIRWWQKGYAASA